MTEGRDWQARIAQAVGRNVRLIREGQSPKMSAQSLASATARLGHPIQRPVITNLENGRRASVTITDLLVLASALKVPPFALLAPLVTDDPVEVLPGEFTSSWDAAKWLDGDWLPENDEGTIAAAIVDAYDYRLRYQIASLQLNDAFRRASRATGDDRELAIETLAVHRARVDELRDALGRLGVQNVPSTLNPIPLLREKGVDS